MTVAAFVTAFARLSAHRSSSDYTAPSLFAAESISLISILSALPSVILNSVGVAFSEYTALMRFITAGAETSVSRQPLRPQRHFSPFGTI